jgi:hypothetical protein
MYSTKSAGTWPALWASKLKTVIANSKGPGLDFDLEHEFTELMQIKVRVHLSAPTPVAADTANYITLKYGIIVFSLH